MKKHVLYTFRRCPYAMRGRFALKAAKIDYEHREVDLKDKPAHMLEISPKGTVPVLLLNDGTVIEESLDVMDWALAQNDPLNWLNYDDNCRALLQENDTSFKQALNKYKYPDRYPGKSQEDYRTEGLEFIQKIENLLEKNGYVCGARPTQIDYAIFPFIRQFSKVDEEWFATAPFPAIQKWLDTTHSSELYKSIMEYFEKWQPTDTKG